ncbi:hypothetical protein Pint_16920 [Pistacia integerrima]|uniref:Uncharacterized protein n=1 Tax=Pistacia integerrima TaxID=434235 RepID=A0ACC0ZB36_9ROSI|nr:hypothetical protein Pint_16920 [Pistacia integerrima]
MDCKPFDNFFSLCDFSIQGFGDVHEIWRYVHVGNCKDKSYNIYALCFCEMNKQLWFLRFYRFVFHFLFFWEFQVLVSSAFCL